MATRVVSRLRQFPAVALLGPRQAGKTALAKRIARAANGTRLDLEDPGDRAKLGDGGAYLRSLRGRLVVLDEVQRVPELFELLRVLMDEQVHEGEGAGQFLLLGSASTDLLRQSGESLAGRVAYLELAPFDLRETGQDQITRLWIRGGFPPSFLAASEPESVVWRDEFVRAYVERDLRELGARVSTETLRRLLTMIAHAQGGLWNAATFARALEVDVRTVTRTLDLLCGLLLVRRLRPFYANVRKRLTRAPRVYLRDSGIVHSLLGLDDEDNVLGHSVCGGSWEGFAIETLIRAAPDRARVGFYRTATGVEMDLLLDLPGQGLWAIEIKRSLVPRTRKGLRVALDDLNPRRAFIAYSGTERYSLGGGLEAVPLADLAAELAALDSR